MSQLEHKNNQKNLNNWCSHTYLYNYYNHLRMRKNLHFVDSRSHLQKLHFIHPTQPVANTFCTINTVSAASIND